MTTEIDQSVLVAETPDVSDPVLFARLFEMLADVHGELGRGDLDLRARRRAAMLLREARRMIRGEMSAALVAEFERVAPELTSEPTSAELRLAYRGTLGWLANVAWFSAPPAPSSADMQEQATA